MTDTVHYLGPPPPPPDSEPPPDPHEPGYDRTPEPPTDPLTDIPSERAVLGAMLTTPHALEAATLLITAPDFNAWQHELIYDAIIALYSRGRPVDTITVANQLGPDLVRAGGHSTLARLAYDSGHVVDVTYYAQQVADKARLRRLREHHHRGLQRLERAHDTPADTLYDATADDLASIPRGVPGVDDDMPGETLDDLLAGDDPDYDWLIPGFLERRDRFILTGAEGAGKSTLLRQLAVQAAAGIHPFTQDVVPPIRVLVVDLENSRDQNRRAYRSLRFAAKRHLDNQNLIVHSKLDGLDLTDRADEAWLDRMITHHRPDLVVTGPIYKLAGGNPNDEVDAKPAAMALDRLREKHGIALLLEAHSRKGENAKSRPKEPFGWSGWMRWPEFGFHIAAEGDLTPWRGQRDAERVIPTFLNRAGTWPWNPAQSLAEQQWVSIRQIARACGGRLSGREMADRVGIGETTFRRHIAGHEVELEQIYRENEGQL